MKDALGRRKRYAPPEYDEKRDKRVILIGANNSAYFRALRDHGQLPAHYLHVFAGGSLEPRTPKQDALSHVVRTTTRRLGRLRNHGYLTRPPKQLSAENNKGQICTYALDKRAIEWLQAEDEWSLYASSFKGHPSHQFYLACFTASMELAARRNENVEYISKEDIFARDTCAVKKSELEVDGEKVIPDSLFGIRFREGDKVSTMYFVVELERAEKSSKQLRDKFSPYDTIIRRRIYKDAWGIHNLRVLVPTVSKARIELIKKQIENLGASRFFLFRNKREIAKEWEVPPIWYDLFDEPWHTTDGDFFINHPKI